MVNRQQMRIFAGHEKPISQRVNDASTVDVNARYIHMVETIRHPSTTTLTDILALLDSSPTRTLLFFRAVHGRYNHSQLELLYGKLRILSTQRTHLSEHISASNQASFPRGNTRTNRSREAFKAAIRSQSMAYYNQTIALKRPQQFLLSPIQRGDFGPYCTVLFTYHVHTILKPGHMKIQETDRLTRKWVGTRGTITTTNQSWTAVRRRRLRTRYRGRCIASVKGVSGKKEKGHLKSTMIEVWAGRERCSVGCPGCHHISVPVAMGLLGRQGFIQGAWSTGRGMFCASF
ncbi:hypothetical protein V8F33_001619 [Rhypophila sp. PSN 637]